MGRYRRPVASRQWTDFTPGDSNIANAYCTSVAVDFDGRVWIAHHLAGASLLDYSNTLDDKTDDRWLHFTSSDGLVDGFTETVAIGPDGRKWFGHTSAISVLNDGGTPFDKADDHWLRFSSISSGVPEGFVNAIIFDDNQCAWVGSDHGLSRMCGQSWLSYEAFGYVWDLAAVHTETNTLIATPNHMTLFSVRGETNRVFLPVAVRVP